MTKLIFLDHDGVICYGKQWGTRFIKQVGSIDNHTKFDINHPDVNLRLDDFTPESVKVLNEILEQTDADIVVSSDWKRYADLDEMKELYKKQGVIKQPIGFTRDMYDDYEFQSLDGTRVKEIKTYIEENGEPDRWVAIDDLNLFGLGQQHFVYCDPELEKGLEEEGIKDKIIGLLNG